MCLKNEYKCKLFNNKKHENLGLIMVNLFQFNIWIKRINKIQI